MSASINDFDKFERAVHDVQHTNAFRETIFASETDIFGDFVKNNLVWFRGGCLGKELRLRARLIANIRLS